MKNAFLRMYQLWTSGYCAVANGHRTTIWIEGFSPWLFPIVFCMGIYFLVSIP
jgi:hypothetical protein